MITYGREYSGELISANPFREGMEQPLTVWVPSIGISGLIFYDGEAFPNWKGQMFMGGLSGLSLFRVGLNERGLADRMISLDEFNVERLAELFRRVPAGRQT